MSHTQHQQCLCCSLGGGRVWGIADPPASCECVSEDSLKNLCKQPPTTWRLDRATSSRQMVQDSVAVSSPVRSMMSARLPACITHSVAGQRVMLVLFMRCTSKNSGINKTTVSQPSTQCKRMQYRMIQCRRIQGRGMIHRMMQCPAPQSVS